VICSGQVFDRSTKLFQIVLKPDIDTESADFWKVPIHQILFNEVFLAPKHKFESVLREENLA
jgi:hypothetical protein